MTTSISPADDPVVSTRDAHPEAGVPRALSTDDATVETVRRRFRASLHEGRVHPLYVALRHFREAGAAGLGR